MNEYKCVPLDENVEEMFIGPFGSSLKNECFVDEDEAYCMVYEQKHAIQKTMDVETRYVNEQKYNELKRFNIHGGDIIVSCRGTIGETFVVPEDAPLGIMHPSIMKIRLKDGVYDKYYFNLLLKSRLKKHEAEANGSGIKMAISATELGRELFPVPTMQEQQEITDIISGISAVIEKRKQELSALDDLIKARFVEMFGDNDKKVAISSLCDVSGGYSFKSEDISSKGFIKILQIGNVYLDDVNWETTNYLPKGFDNVYSRFLLNEGDIVIALTRPIIQSLGNVKACIVKASDTPCLLNQRVGRIVSKKNVDVNLKFIYGCLMTDDFTRYVESCCIGCSQPNISTKDIENYMIPDASYEKQMDFVKFKEQVDKSKVAVQKALDETQLLFDSLMQQYFG